ncbi:MAG: hypothetical protein ACI31D_10265, partial [Candidatus Limisoma sp.]
MNTKKTLRTVALCIASACLSPSIVQATNSTEITTHQVTPTRLVWLSDSTEKYVKRPNNLLKPFCGQVSVYDTTCVTLKSDSTHKASLLIDFGEEMNGGVVIYSCIRDEQKPVKLHLCFGESVSEAM